MTLALWCAIGSSTVLTQSIQFGAQHRGGHGIGKAAIPGLVNIVDRLSTRPNAKGVVTANTAEQLPNEDMGGTWQVATHVHPAGIGSTIQAAAARCRWCFAIRRKPGGLMRKRVAKENSEAFAGMHSAGSTPFYIFDEASAIPDKIYEVSEGGTTDGEPMWFQTR